MRDAYRDDERNMDLCERVAAESREVQAMTERAERLLLREAWRTEPCTCSDYHECKRCAILDGEWRPVNWLELAKSICAPWCNDPHCRNANPHKPGDECSLGMP